MSVSQSKQVFSVDEFVESIEEELGDLPENSSGLMYENIGDGDLLVYDLEQEQVWIQRGVKTETKKGNEIRIYGDKALVEVETDDDIFKYERIGGPEKKYNIISHGRVHEKTDIVRDAMKDGFPGFREGEGR